MVSRLSNLLNIGNSALQANQTALQTIGNNIANVNTEGYSRQLVRMEQGVALNGRAGQIGTGVQAVEVYRVFDRFVERNYLNKSSQESRWESQLKLLQNVETLFNESNTYGIASFMQEFFDAWQQVVTDPSSTPNRTALLNYAQLLTSYINDTEDSLLKLQQQVEQYMQQDVDTVNTLVRDIAALNQQIDIYTIQGHNNANALLDERDQKVRQLAQLIDVDVVDNGVGNYSITTSGGLTLVQNDVSYSLTMQGPTVTASSSFDGTVTFTGSDQYEFTLEVVDEAGVDSGGNPTSPTYRVSIDGGKTWLKDDNGDDQLFEAGKPAAIGDIEITFDGTMSTLSTGDKFTIMPKSGVYWVSPTTGLVNITPQTYNNGQENQSRITGGSLSAYFNFRDYEVGEYRDRLDALAKALIWEVNQIHSQGSGTEYLSYANGTSQVKDTTIALGSKESGLAFWDKLQEGNLTFALYDENGNLVPTDYDSNGDPIYTNSLLSVNFDPKNDSLEDLVKAIQGLQLPNGDPAFDVSIVNGQLFINPHDSSHSFGFTGDTSGILAALGINTFFQGSGSSDIAVRQDIVSDLNLINAGKIDSTGMLYPGDSSIALELAQLTNKNVTISTMGQKGTTQTLVGYYANLVAKVGSDTSTAKYNSKLYAALASELRATQESTSGVSLDEELTSLVKFQSSYKAAAKLVTTSDEMLQTILGLKQ